VISINGKKGALPLILTLLAVWVGLSIFLTKKLVEYAPCVNYAPAFIGMLLLVAAIVFGVSMNIFVGGVSGSAGAVFLLIACSNCL